MYQSKWVYFKIVSNILLLYTGIPNSSSYLHSANRNNDVCFKGDRDIKGVKLPGEGNIDSLESKLCMFADDTQIINKDEDSLKKSFHVLSPYEIDSV